MIKRIKVKDLITGKEVWIEENTTSTYEVCEISPEKMKLAGLVKGYKPKNFSDMTEEEQRLFTENDNTEK